MKPLAIDLFCGLGGWAEGLLAEGWDVIGFDNVRHDYGSGTYPGQLVIQDVLTLHGSQFRNASLIVASPPCQTYSWMAQPWSRAKREGCWQRWLRDSPFSTGFHLNDLFNACFRIQREASEAAGHPCFACDGLGPRHPGHVCPRCNGTCWVTRHIPMVVENVKGAQPWVGQAQGNFGSYFIWGDVGRCGNYLVVPGKWDLTLQCPTRTEGKFNPDGTGHGQGSWFAVADSKQRGSKVPGISFNGYGTPGYEPKGFNVTAAQRYREGQKLAEYSDPRRNGGKGVHMTAQHENTAGLKRQHIGGGSQFEPHEPSAYWSKSDSRKAASAQIAKIPFPLAQWVGQVFRP